MRKAAPEHRPDLRDLARGAEPVETGGERLLQGRRDRSVTPAITSFDNAWRVAISPTIRAISPASSGASEITPWCDRCFQGGRNSGRVVAMISSGACAPRSASACNTSSEVGSAQCRSSNASTIGWVRAPAKTQAASAASWRLRNSSGESFGARPGGIGASITGASKGAYSPASSPTEPSAASSSARRFSPATSEPPKRAARHRFRLRKRA
jgi:hypothetical protein